MRKWCVERGGNYPDRKIEAAKIHHMADGTIVFLDSNDSVVLMLAPGSWSAVIAE